MTRVARVAAPLCLLLWAAAAHAGEDLDRIRARRLLRCGVSEGIAASPRATPPGAGRASTSTSAAPSPRH